jgi:hypothetical protein
MHVCHPRPVRPSIPLLAAAGLVWTLSACTAAAPPGPLPSLEPSLIGSEQYHVTDLRPGDCLAAISADLRVAVVPCDVGHRAEFSTVYVLDEGPWPGTDAAMRRSVEWCAAKMRVRPEKRDTVKAGAILPLESDWPRARTAYCVAVPVRGELVGRVLS